MISQVKSIRVFSFIGLVLISCLFIISTYINKPVYAAGTDITVLIKVADPDSSIYGGFKAYLYNPDGNATTDYVTVTDQEMQGGDSIIAAKLTTTKSLSSDGWKVCIKVGEKNTCGDVIHESPIKGVGGGYKATIEIANDLLKVGGVINAYVNIAKEASDTSTFGPLDLKLLSGDQVIDTVTAKEKSDNKGSSKTISLSAQFGGLSNRSYKICLVSYDKCSGDPQAITKASDVLDLTINLTADEYTAIITNNTSSCAIDGVGWIVCPITKFLAKIADGAFRFISGNFLEIKSEAFNTTSATYKTWSIMRNFANILFVIVFMIIVISQMTSVGITNYGVKKMLPRLIVAAILVNLSYFICQIAIDISNIVGYSLNSFLNGFVGNKITGSGVSSAPNFGQIITGILIAGGVAGAVFFAILSISIPIIIAAGVALIMIALILIARQAVVILLVVVAPIAFVAYLLPNTNNLFKQWKKMFTAVLLVFPIVALVFGGSSLAATVLSGAFNDADSKYFGPIIVGAINVLPLFVVPSLLKKSLDGVGNIGATMNNLGSKFGKGLGSTYANSDLNKHLEGKRQAKKTLIDSGEYNYTGKNPYKRLGNLSSKFNKGFNSSRFSGEYGNKRANKGATLMAEIESKNIKESGERLAKNNPNWDDNRILARGGKIDSGLDSSRDLSMRQAAIQKMVAENDVDGIRDLWDESSSWQGDDGVKLRNTFANALRASSSRPAYYNQRAISSMSQGTNEQATDDLIREAISNNTYSSEKIATSDATELGHVARVADADQTQPGVDQLRANADRAATDEVLNTKLGKNIQQVNRLRGTATTNTTTAPVDIHAQDTEANSDASRYGQ